LLTEKMKKTNRLAAVVTRVALTSMYATVAARNFAIASGGR
jgi:hypothetical protein